MIPRNTRTLVLSQGYEILGVVSWKKSIELVYRNKVEIVTEYKDLKVHSPSVAISLPSIIKYKKGQKFRRFKLRFSRRNIYIRDRGICQYCGREVNKKSFTCDHVIPKKHGGQKTWHNIVLACSQCNSLKADYTLREAAMSLISEPKKPDNIREFLLFSIKQDLDIPEDWKAFLGGG